MGRLYRSVKDPASDALLIFVWSLLPKMGTTRVGDLASPRPQPGLPDDARLPQPPLVGVLPGEGELLVGEAVEVVLVVVDEPVRGPALLTVRLFELVEALGPAAALLPVRYPPHEGSVRGGMSKTQIVFT